MNMPPLSTGSKLTIDYFRKSAVGPLLFWPLLCLVLGLLMWGAVLIKARSDLELVGGTAVKDAASYAEAYEHYVARSLSQIDQITMQLKYGWEHSAGAMNLEDLRRNGMFTDPVFVSVAVYDANGASVTSTGQRAVPASIANDAAFSFHRNNNSTALRMDAPDGRESEAVLRFSKRLEAGDDAFSGVVVLVVRSDYFTSFYNTKVLGRKGMLMMIDGQHKVRLERNGDLAAPHQRSILTGDPVFSTNAGAGLQKGADWFSDKEDRVLAWRESSVYPFTVLIGLSRDELEAPAREAALARRNQALAATGALLLAAIFGGVFAKRRLQHQNDQAALRESYRVATEGAADGFYMARAIRNNHGAIVDFEIIDCNERGARFYSMSREEMIGTRFATFVSHAHSRELIATYSLAMEKGVHEDEVRMPVHNRIKIGWAYRRLVRTSIGLAVTLQDISERKAHEQQLQRMANEDMLTGLPNRHWLAAFLPSALERSARDGSQLALLFVDLDDFKHVNDTHGHAVGDELLEVVAARLKSVLRKDDRVVRFGGDEFIVLLTPIESQAQAEDTAERIVRTCSMPFGVADKTFVLGASVGISVYPRDGVDAQTLIRHSDVAMYSSKSEGKGQYRFYDASLHESLKSKAHLKQSLFDAIAEEQFVLYYQPRVDTQTGRLCSMEALVRWIHPKRGLVPPLEFIPLAEATGLIQPLGRLVINMACAQLSAWQARGIPLVPISINVSPSQFSHGEIHCHLAEEIEKAGISASLLEVEITESAMMGDQAEIMAELSAIRDLGIKLHIDDFGTGYSSLSQLQRLKMDVLKVDKAFTSELTNSRDGKVFFQAIVSMAHALGMTVVAEGVETAEQMAMLQSLSCDEVQGYFIARPMPAHDIEPLLARPARYAPLQATRILQGSDAFAVADPN
ncbi:diguanylate cyclase (GGDEF) domain-containing protein [Noviherbaspirillum suwonense]|uniref:Diguanylate cyclase (GGDEF) domain-containing protein n=1 Tax=Noviherbaspirillum suwonense TaxID=1224511 RepID=A0ABY1QBL9_9BURK|nr:diguanylate cyclase (GGDEF) domain-containing protein [Noviherbaspirillum suwonense]